MYNAYIATKEKIPEDFQSVFFKSYLFLIIDTSQNATF